MASIREKDGIHLESNRSYVLDSRNASGDVNFISHAHFDHLHVDEDSKLVCSNTTAELASERSGSKLKSGSDLNIEMIQSGHIIGSRSALIEVNGERILYTGDFSPRSRQYLEGFDPVKADTLIIESTYGVPKYRFPDQRELESTIQDWVENNSNRGLFLFGYSLGKAQKIQQMIQGVTDREIVAHGAVKRMNDAVEKLSDLEFKAKSYGENKELITEGNAVFVGPPRFSRSDSVEKMVQKTDGIKAGFSGWGVENAYKFRAGYDRVFPMSDHADFDELIQAVKQVDPEKVYTTHGFTDALASNLSSEHGFSATSLKKNQSTLNDF